MLASHLRRAMNVFLGSQKSRRGTCGRTRCFEPTETLESRIMLTTFYVDDDAAIGGDGSQGNPFQSIQAAIDEAASNDGDDIIDVAAGTYFENLQISDSSGGLVISGSSGDRSTVVLSNLTTADSIAISGSFGVSIENLTIDADDSGTPGGSYGISAVNSLVGGVTAPIRGGLNVQNVSILNHINDAIMAQHVGDVEVNGAILTNNNGGVDFESVENVSLLSVDASSNRGHAGQVGSSTSLTVQGGNYSDNDAAGLIAIGTNSVNVFDDAVFNGNVGNGLTVLDFETASISSIVVSGNGTSQEDGLVLSSSRSSTIELSQIVASNNAGAGVGLRDVTGAVTSNGLTAQNNTVGLFASVDPAAGVSLSIDQAGFSGNAHRGVDLEGFQSTTLNRLTISDNGSNNSGVTNGGGGVRFLTEAPNATLTLTNSLVHNNVLPFPFRGGGLAINGSVVATLDSVTITNNTAGYEGGGISFYAIGVGSEIRNSLIDGNSASLGGGINYNISEEDLGQAGTLTVVDTTVNGNSAGSGGGIYHLNQNLTIRQSTISFNTADSFGGGGGVYVRGNTTIENSTISSNQADYDGGGIAIRNNPFTFRMLFSTVTNNIATRDGGGIDEEGSNNSVAVGNSIIAGNFDETFDPSHSPDANGAFFDLSFNLVGDASGSTGWNSRLIGNDRSPIDPQLGPLDNNGGRTQTHALTAGSQAIDAVGATNFPLTTDQRGIARPQGAARDIGSFEFVLSSNAPPVADDQSITVGESTQYSGQLTGSDANGDTLTYQLVQGPSNEFSFFFSSSGAFSYRPIDGFTGSDSFTFRAYDGVAFSEVATVSITVVAVNVPPVARDDSYSTLEETALVVTASNGTTELDQVNERNTGVHLFDGTFFNLQQQVVAGKSGLLQSIDLFVNDQSDVGEELDVFVNLGPAFQSDTPDFRTIYQVQSADIGNWITIDVSSANIQLNTGDAFTLGTFPRSGSGQVFVQATNSSTFGGDNYNAGSLWVDGTERTSPSYDLFFRTRVTPTSETGGVLTNDTDQDGDPLTASLVQDVQHGTLQFNSNGTFTYTPDENSVGQDFFTYAISDGQGGTDSATVTITVDSINDPPVANNDSYTVAEDGALVVPAPAGPILRYGFDESDSGTTPALNSGTAPEANATLESGATRTLNTPGNASRGALDLTVQDFNPNYATPGDIDEIDAMDALTVTLWVNLQSAAANGDVLLSDLDTQGGNGGWILDFTSSSGQILPVFSLVENESNTSSHAAGRIFTGFDADNKWAFLAVTYTEGQVLSTFLGDETSGVSQAGNSSNVDIPLLPNNGPLSIGRSARFPNANLTPPAWLDDIRVYDHALSESELEAVRQEALVPGEGVLANDTDPDNNALTARVIDSPSHGELTFFPDGTFHYQPDGDFNGVDTFTYVANDGTVDSAPATVTINVTPVNDAPVAVSDDFSLDEDQSITIPVASIVGNDTDIDGDTLSIGEITSGPSFGTLTVNVDGSLTYTPIENASGFTDTIFYRPTDGSTDSENVGLIRITVNPVNDPPLAIDDSISISEDSQSIFIDVLANDSLQFDDFADPIEVLTVIGVTDPANGTVTFTPGGVTYTPNANFFGTDTLTYTISDSNNGGTDTATVTINVTGVQDPPNAVDDTASTDEDTAVVIDVLTNDTDVDGDTLSITSTTIPPNGTVVVNADGTITYTPNADFNGEDTFSYTLSDLQGGTDTATVTVTVNAINDPPVANDDTATTDEDNAVVIEVLANDTDSDGGTLSIESTTAAANGTVVVNADGTITYTPNADFNGEDTFSYTLSDLQGGTDTATVTVTVNAVNDPPVANDDTATTDEDTAAVIEVLANDTDSDGGTLSITSTTIPPNGTVVVNPDGTITYTPNADFNGEDTFSYTLSDLQGGTDTATVTVTVNAINDPPVANDDTATTDEDNAVVIEVLANDTDSDGGTLSIESTTAAANGTVVVNADGTITYTPNADFNGDDTFSYTLSDLQGGTDTATVIITVNAINDPPVANDDTATTDEDNAAVIEVLANDTDRDGGTLTVDSTTAAANGTVVVNPDGTITYTPNADFNGEDTFSYTLSDLQGGTDTATVIITVNAINDPPVANDDTATTDEDNAAVIEVLANDTDRDGGTLTVDSTTAAANGTVVVNADGTITYTPNADFNGEDSFSYTLSDSQGGTDTATVIIIINAVNDPPVANDDTATTTIGVSIDIDVLANDVDIEGEDLTIVFITNPTNGSVTQNSDGSLTYIPNTGFVGQDSFSYEISDDEGSRDTATVTIRVDGLTAQDQLDLLIAQVSQLRDVGVLSKGQSKQLLGKLKLSGNHRKDVRTIEQFIDRVDKFVNSGTLPSEQAQPLLDGAENLLNLLSGLTSRRASQDAEVVFADWDSLEGELLSSNGKSKGRK